MKRKSISENGQTYGQTLSERFCLKKEENLDSGDGEDVNLATSLAMNQSTVAEGNSKTRRPVTLSLSLSRQKPREYICTRNNEIDSLAW